MDTCRSHKEISVTLLPATPDEDLVAEARLGDRSAFAELWNRHSRTTFTRVYRITKNRADAEDVIQEVWLKAFVHLNTFDGRAKFSTWLTRIAINSALMTLRRKRSHPETPMEFPDGETWRSREFADHTKDIEKHYVKCESVERLRRAIRQLRPQLRTVIEIQQAKDGQVKEVADIAGISLSAAKSRLLRARTILRRALD
jgi:RNA polymerase sigma-70 factor (ECF subfamily)